MENNTENIIQDTSSSPVDDFNLGLLIYVLNKSVIWVILIILFSVTFSIIYLRYAPRIYQSKTTLMLKTQKSTEILGIQDLIQEQDESEITREIQLLKSKMLIDRIAQKLPLGIGYYKEGKTKFINSELYTSSPFVVKATDITSEIQAIPIYTKIISASKVYISFTINGKEYEYKKDTGKLFVTPFFTATISTVGKLATEDFSEVYYFKILNPKTVTDDVSNRLEVLPIDPKTKTIGLQYNDRNPLKCKQIVSQLALEFIEYDIEKKKEGFINILQFINDQIDSFGTSNDKFQDSISLLRLQDGFLASGGKYLDEMASLPEKYEQKIRDLEYDIAILKTFKQVVGKNKEYSNLPTLRFRATQVNFDSEIHEINVLQQQRNTVLLDATPQHPRVRMIDKQVEDFKVKLNQNFDNAIKILYETIDFERAAYAKLMADLIRIPDLQNKFSRLDKMADLKNSFVMNLYGQKSSYLIASAGIVSDYVILEQANLPSTPVSPNENLTKIAGFVIGLLLGLIVIVVRYLLHDSIISVGDVERKTKAAILGVVPRHKEEMSRSQIVVIQDPKATITEAFRGIRANLQFIPTADKSKILSTTSTIPGEGKTFVSINIAAILSMLNKKVIILDFDMRKPRLNKIFDVDSHKGVSSILSGQCTIEECILDSGIPNLDFITSGPVPPNPSELILLPSLTETLTYLKSKYDYIIIDTPPIGLVTDALEILKVSDYPIYVVRAAYSKRTFVQNINRIVQENKIKNLSIVINDYGRGASAYGQEYGYDYGYGYGYGYGYYGTKYGGGYYSDEVAKTKPNLWSKIFGGKR